MHLKKVEISGFKSFLDRTCLEFQPGVTAVVGPNGCGKSNVVDAIRWAMGEQSAKALRGQTMEDVIFNGSDVHHPLGMAEVILTFENTNGDTPPHLAGCSEIEVCRRLFRSGESEYSINRVPCRRRDVWELFMDTGLGNRSYAIVEQDRVARIIQSRPEERRVIIEEVAGISKYKARREAAQRKMEATRQNLVRVQDLRRELGHQIQGLERQARRAERFKELRRKMLDLERSILLRKWAELRSRQLAMEQQFAVLQRESTQLYVRLQAEETSLEGERLCLMDAEASFKDLQGQVLSKEAELQSLETKARSNAQEIQRLEDLGVLLKEEIEHLEAKIARGAQEARRISAEVALLERDKSDAKGVEGKLREELQVLSGELDRLQAGLEAGKARLVEWLSERASVRNSIGHHRRRAEEAKQFLERNEQERRALEGRIKAFQEELDAATSKVRMITSRLGQLKDRRSVLVERLEVTDARRREASVTLDAKKGEVREARSRLEVISGLQRSLEGFPEGVRTLRSLSERGELSGLGQLRVVAEVMEVEEGAELAVSSLLGERLQCLIVEDLEQARNALEQARQKGLGRVSFVSVRESRAAGFSRRKGVEEQGKRLAFQVRWEPGYEALEDVFFREVRLVDGSREAIDLWRSGRHLTFVTRQGDVLSAQGILEGGERKDASAEYLRRKRQMRSLERTVRLLSEEEERQRRITEELESEVSALTQQLETVRREIQGAEMELAEANKEMRVLEEGLKTARHRSAVLQWEAEEREKELSEVQALLSQEAGRSEELEGLIARAQAELKQMEDYRQRLQERIEGVREEMTSAQVQLASVEQRIKGHQRHLQRLQEETEELATERAKKEALFWEGTRRIESLREELRQAREDLQQRMEKHRNAKEALEALQKGLEERRASLAEREKNLIQERRRAKELDRALQDLHLEQREVALRMEHLEGDLTGRLEMEPDAIPGAAAALTPLPRQEEERRLAELRESLASMGEVNLTAAEQYEELKSRYDFLTAQQEDLEESISSLQKAIHKINRASRRRFREAFVALDEQFRKVFPVLFQGGEAHLLLTEGPDVLDAGVEIVARPPGKRLQSISLLSGGEKALTAVALIFAMIMIKPPPFCLMDEVDAPLDDANIDRFNQMVKDLSKGSQFILVTHNKRTMEMADALYGITMETPGVSKLISVRLQ